MDAERVLGALLRQGMRQGGNRSRSDVAGLTRGAVGMGLLGVAVAAFDHFVTQKRPGAESPHLPAPGPTPTRPDPARAPLPPSAGPPPPPPPPPAPPGRPKRTDDDAVLLVRAMIAAANADGVIDEPERRHILGQLDAAGLGSEERMFVLTELLAPKSMEQIAAAVRDPEQARLVYAASRCAIDVDTDAEQTFLSGLARALGLSAETVAAIENSVGRRE